MPYFGGHLSGHSQLFRLNELDFQGPGFSDISQRQDGTNGRVPIQIGCHCHLEIDRATWRGFIVQPKHCDLPGRNHLHNFSSNALPEVRNYLEQVVSGCLFGFDLAFQRPAILRDPFPLENNASPIHHNEAVVNTLYQRSRCEVIFARFCKTFR